MGILSNIFCQKSSNDLTIFENIEQNYTIKYPKSWTVKKNNEGIITIESKEKKCGIYISMNKGITFPDEHMEDFIIESNYLPISFKTNILSNKEKGVKTWIVSYTDPNNNLTCMSMYKRMNDKLWFISSECAPNEWRNGWKEKIVEILTSFNIKGT